MKTFILIIAKDTDRFDRGTWITSAEAEEAPELGDSEDIYAWVLQEGMTKTDIEAHVMSKSSEPNFAGYKTIKYSKVKTAYTASDAQNAPLTTRRGDTKRSLLGRATISVTNFVRSFF